MFRRTFWFTAGAAAGVWATTKVNRKIKQLTPESLAAQAADKALETGHRLKDFALDVRDGMVRREAELGGALGLHDPVDAGLPPRHHLAVEAAAPLGEAGGPHRTTTYRTLPSNSNNRNEDH
ncbi:hypothetical protein [Streptomyces nitrosporeus]|uniref:Secreted protein n=1 Tax=Streptomyces nitrosporeus TaxID=28894 RepID=A0A5J6FHG3_9ACTN|nr:hypothetical protein [Streptomyces nitrosporeus]QEU75471.1 hypothetical protein CP967_28950 [Streptomyces nitrosporeus]GGZ01840.1 hypothetical protein GCM10010327_35340 [Streptomyces nitrosporeus]